ncbi:MAG: mechanosensitive ion channel family protein [Bacteroidia bacterium]|nr:mechanosensitive ion channel family protein [Bacteroidia bacterium]
MSTEFLNLNFLGNTVENYLWCFGIILFGIIFQRLLSRVFALLLYRIFKKYSGNVGVKEFQDLLHRPFATFVILVAGYIGFNYLEFPVNWNVAPEEKFGLRMVIHRSYLIAVIISITWVFLRIVDFMGLILIDRATRTSSRLDDQLIPFFKDGLKIFIAILCFFFILASVFNVNIVTLIGGLGIGGLAVALAAKETLENLLGSFTIFLDKPFVVGDHVKVGAFQGHVETIGLRSTRIRTLDKSLVTVPNKKMVDAELENITQRTMWRSRTVVSLICSTPQDSVQKIISQIKEFLDHHPKIREGSTVNFDIIGQSSLDVLTVYFVRTTDADEFAEVKEEINFRIMEIVRSNGSDFAYPSTSIYIEKNN